MRVARSLLVAILLLVSLRALALGADEPFVTKMMPPSVVRGGSTRVTLYGSDLGGAIALWTSTSAEQIRARVVDASQHDQATLEITTTPNAPLGLHGLRLATTSGLSNVQLFLLDDLPPQPLVGAVASGAEPEVVSLPVAIPGTFRSGQVDRWLIDVTNGESIAFEAVSSRLGKDSDPLLRVRDSQGRVVFEYDNDPGLFFDFRVEHTFRAAGRYVVELCDARFEGQPDWSYVLRMGRFPAVRVAVPAAQGFGLPVTLTFPELPGVSTTLTPSAVDHVGAFYHAFRRPTDSAASWIALARSELPPVVEVEPNDTLDRATPVPTSAMLCGVLGKPNDLDHFAFHLKKSDRVTLKAETAALDSAADVELLVFNADGRELQRIDDVQLEEAALSFTAPKDGLYWLAVREITSAGGPTYAYRIQVRPAGPQLQLLADFSGVTLPQATYQSFPLILTRTEFTGAVHLQLEGAPPGVTLEPTVIPEGATLLMASLKAADTAPLGVYTLRVVATADANGTPLRGVARTLPMIDRQLLNVDLIKYALRENQRRLPPSLADRVALQITPPAPFSFELPESLVTLVRYLSVDVPFVTSRRAEFTGSIEFDARGGQMGKETELRRQVYARFVPATVTTATVAGKFFSRNLAQETKDRIDVTARGEHSGRWVTLVRSFELDLKAAYEVKVEPPTVTIQPGETTRVPLQVVRRPPFTGRVTIEPVETPGVSLPTALVVDADQAAGELIVTVPAEAQPRKVRISLPSKAQVGPYEEDGGRPKVLDLDIKMLPKPTGEVKK